MPEHADHHQDEHPEGDPAAAPSVGDPAGGRARQRTDQRPEEDERQRVDRRKLGLGEQREAGRVADEGAEGPDIEPAHDPVVLALEDHRLIGERRLGGGDIVHAEPGRESAGDDERHPDEAGVLQPHRRRLRSAGDQSPDRRRTSRTRPTVMTIGTTNCTTLTPRLPRPALSASALPFSARGKKKEMLAIDEAKLPPPKSAQQRQRQEHRIGRRRILYGVANTDRGNQQRPGRQRGPEPAAEDRHHEGVEDPQHRAGYAGQAPPARTARPW